MEAEARPPIRPPEPIAVLRPPIVAPSVPEAPRFAVAPLQAAVPPLPAPPPGAPRDPGGPARPAAAPRPGDAAAASDAAAAASKETPAPAQPRSGAPRAAAPREPAREHVDLLWFDAGELPRIRADKALGDVPSERKGPTWAKGDREAAPRDQEIKDRRDVLAILTRSALDEPGLGQAARAAYHDDGVFSAPLALVGGELALTFDEVETLRATLTVVQPFLGQDKKLRDVVAGATEIQRSEWTVTGDVAEGLTRRVEEAFAQGPRAVAPGYLETTVERMLLEGRRYRRRTLLGEPRIRALLTLPGGGAAVPTYLPDALAPRLPLFRRFRAKAVVELRPQEDQYEAHADALIVLALGRVLSRAT